jgi:hypothetical protein
MEENKMQIKKFSIKFIGEHKHITEFEKIHINEVLSRFADNFNESFMEGLLIFDIKYKQGNHNKGKYRGQPLVYLKARLLTDKGMFLANKENWGVKSALHDTLIILTKQIRESLRMKNEKERAQFFISERKMVKT